MIEVGERAGGGRCCLGDQELRLLLAEDKPCGDLTTEALGIGGRAAKLEFLARGAMSVCSTEEAARMFELEGASVELLVPSGMAVPAGAVLLRASGSAAALHGAWKAAQTLVEACSGIATAARAIVDVLAGAERAVAVACTRKNFPGTKALSVKAVKAGGAIMHRLGLSETLLVFPEHRLFCAQSPAEIVAALRRRQPEKKIVVEVKNEDEALLWARAGADVLQFERFSPERLAGCIAVLSGEFGGRRPLCAAAGGVKLGNALAYARAGADFLVSSSPYFAGPADVEVRFSVA